MDYRINKEELAVCTTVLDGCQEQPVDLDFSLPDYCPDIQRILKCQVYPTIQMKNISGDRLDVDGVYVVKIIYLDSERMAIRCCEHSSPFSSSFQMKGDVMDPVAFTKTKVEYLNCRAVSPRKLDIHGAFSVCAKVVGRQNQQVVCGVEGDDLQQMKKPVTAGSVVCTAQQQFSISEVLEISQGKPEAQSIVRVDATPIVHDTKIIANKLIIKGEAVVKVLYSASLDEGELETMEYTIPVSQIIDADGLREDSTCSLKLEVLGCEIQIREDSSGEANLLSMDLKIAATVLAFEDKAFEIVTDGYSTDYETELSYGTNEFERLLESTNDTCVSKNAFELGDDSVSKIVDVWNEIINVNAQKEENKIVFKGKYNVCVLAVGAEDTPFYKEKMVEFEFSREFAGNDEQLRISSDAFISSISYRITGASELEVRVELSLQADIYAADSFKSVLSIEAFEDRPKTKDASAALVIYYADKGEAIWNIARDYCTSIEAIKQENELDCDVLENRQMLLIPV